MCVCDAPEREKLESLREAGVTETPLLQNNECWTTCIVRRAKVHMRKYMNLDVSGPGPGPQLHDVDVTKV